MKPVLGVSAVACFAISVGSCAFAKGAVHEIQGLIWLIAGVILFAGASVIEAVESLTSSQLQLSKEILDRSPRPEVVTPPPSYSPLSKQPSATAPHKQFWVKLLVVILVVWVVAAGLMVLKAG